MSNFETAAQKQKCWKLFFGFSWAGSPETTKNTAGKAKARHMNEKDSCKLKGCRAAGLQGCRTGKSSKRLEAGGWRLEKAGKGWRRLAKAGTGWKRLAKAGIGWNWLEKAETSWKRLGKAETG